MADPPRLTYITTAHFPAPKASTVQVMQMCAAFAEAGALVKLVARSEQSSDEVFAHYGLPPTFILQGRPLPRLPRASDIFQARAVFAEPRADWICYTRIRDLTAPVLALARGAKAGVELHGKPATLRERILLRWIARHPRGRLMVISEPLKEMYWREYGLATHLTPDAVDLKRFTPPQTAALARKQLDLDDGPWVVYVGGLYEGRGLETLFAAAAGLPVKVLVVGGRNADDVAVWQAKAVAAGASSVRFEGYQPPARAPLYLFAADVLVMPYGKKILTGSGEDITAWTSPLKLYEYAAAGRPIVSTDVRAVRPVLRHEANALLAEPESVDSLRAALKRVIDDPALAQRLAANARQTVEGKTWTARAKQILEIILT